MISVQTLFASKARGFSLIELMIGITVGMLGILVIFQMFSVSENYKRTTVSGGDAQQSGAIAMFTLERDVRQAGYGIADLITARCQVQWNRSGTAMPALGPLRAIDIAQGAGDASDEITVIYSALDNLNNNSTLAQPYAGNLAPLELKTTYGFQRGHWIVLQAPGVDCSMLQVTDIAGTQLTTAVNGTSFTDFRGLNSKSILNPAGGLGIAYLAEETTVYNWGEPSILTYRVTQPDPGRPLYRVLEVRNAAGNAGWQEVADNIVSIQAQYGFDTTATPDGTIDRWLDTLPGGADDQQRVIAVRIAVVAMSGLREKEVVTPASFKLWRESALAGSSTAPQFALSGDAGHYRYKTYESVIPLKSRLWQPEAR